MFSERVPPSLEPNRITQAVRRARAAGRPLLDLTITNPTTVGLRISSLDARAAWPRRMRMRYDPQPFGLPEARRAVACDYARRGIEVNPERIVLTASTSEAYSLLFKLLCRPERRRRDGPGAELSALRASDDARRRAVDPVSAGLSRTMDAGGGRPRSLLDPAVRAVLAVSPNNPTGSVLSPEELETLSTLCAERDAALIVDEVFADYSA